MKICSTVYLLPDIQSFYKSLMFSTVSLDIETVIVFFPVYRVIDDKA